MKMQNAENSDIHHDLHLNVKQPVLTMLSGKPCMTTGCPYAYLTTFWHVLTT